MDFLEVFMDMNFWMNIIREFQNIGPLGPILLAASESLFSFLPLIAIVTFHVGLYGEFLGFLYSWIGTTLGSAIVFLMVRFCSSRISCFDHLTMIKKLRLLISKQDQFDLFLITACAFMPSFLINVSYGVSEFDSKIYLKTIIYSKSIMTATLVLFGSTIKKAMEQPLFIILSFGIFICLYSISKQLKKKLQNREKTNV